MAQSPLCFTASSPETRHSPKNWPPLLRYFKGFGLNHLSFLLVLLVFPAGLKAAPLPAEMGRLIQNGSVLLLDQEGKTLLEHQADRPRVPASIIKILTSQVMIDRLGVDFSAQTLFYLGPNGELGIQGRGDPFLISEEIALIAQKLKAQGHRKFTSIRLDASQFAVPAKAPGTSGTSNPYDALNSALAVNFNSLFVGRKKNGTPYSAEEVTPLTPLARQKAKALRRGVADRINLTDRPQESLQYVGELFAAIFEREGIKTGQGLSFGSLSGYQLILDHRNTRKLEVMLEGLLKYSNNYIANQLLLILGAESEGWPATRKKALKAYRSAVADRFGPPKGRWELVEASGISRENRLTARFMGEVLMAFRPHQHLLSKHKRVKKVSQKSGTLTGVYNYAGYLNSPAGARPFVIILEQRKNRRDQLVKLLAEWQAD